jgi:hypothetical protein
MVLYGIFGIILYILILILVYIYKILLLRGNCKVKYKLNNQYIDITTVNVFITILIPILIILICDLVLN